MKQSNWRTAFFIAWRYLFAKKDHNIVNIISAISIVGVMVSAAALIIVLSVYNGMEKLVVDHFNAFNADFKITPQAGKSFLISDFPKDKIAQMPEVKAIHEIVSDLTLLAYEEKQTLIHLKGVEPQYGTAMHMDSIMIDGDYLLRADSVNYGIMGVIAAGNIQLNLLSRVPLQIYYPQRNRKNLSNAASAFQRRYLTPSGVFMTNTDYDGQYLFCDINFARSLMDYENECTSMEITLQEGAPVAKIQKRIATLLGSAWLVQNRYQQEEILFKSIKLEKLIIYIILSLILLLSAFNIVGTLSMLIVEKKRDINILYNIGAGRSLIKKIFIMEGMLESFAGGILGLAIGFVVCLAQKTFHIVKLGPRDGNYIIDYYPVELQGQDFLLVCCLLLIISLIVSRTPSKRIIIDIKNLNS